MPDYPHRLRLHGGRNTHATGYKAGFADLVTACGYAAGPKDEAKPDDAVVTCRACAKELTR